MRQLTIRGFPAELEKRLASGKDILVQLDVQGMRNLRASGLALVAVFVMPPSLDVLKERLKLRGADGADEIALRLHNARAEMEARHEYDYVVINDDLDTAVQDFLSIVRAERCKENQCA